MLRSKADLVEKFLENVYYHPSLEYDLPEKFKRKSGVYSARFSDSDEDNLILELDFVNENTAKDVVTAVESLLDGEDISDMVQRTQKIAKAIVNTFKFEKIGVALLDSGAWSHGRWMKRRWGVHLYKFEEII